MSNVRVIDAPPSLHSICTRCHTKVADTDRVCASCGIAVHGTPVHMDVSIRVRLLDALAVGDLDEIVRVTLGAHADALLWVGP